MEKPKEWGKKIEPPKSQVDKNYWLIDPNHKSETIYPRIYKPASHFPATNTIQSRGHAYTRPNIDPDLMALK